VLTAGGRQRSHPRGTLITTSWRFPASLWGRVIAIVAVALLVAATVMATSVLALSNAVPVESRLHVGFQGTITVGAYRSGEGEHVMDSLTVTGARISTPGTLAVNGPASAVAWAFRGLGKAGIAQRILSEIVVSPKTLQHGGTLVDLAGAVRLEAVSTNQVRVVTGTVERDYPLPDPIVRNGLPVHDLGLLTTLDDAGTGTVALVAKDGAVGEPLAVTGAKPSGPGVVFAAGMTGTVYGVGLLTGARIGSPQLTSLPCTTTVLDRANRVPVHADECSALIVSKASSLRPTDRQVAWQQAERTAFVHFGVNTYTGAEWGSGDEDPNVFQPTGLDTDQWARTLRDNGFRIAILTVKHHDGFVLYPSRYTSHDVASSSWRGGHGDVVRSFVTSARRYGLKVGFYLSPADSNQNKAGVFANGSKPTQRTIPTLVNGDNRVGRDMPSFQFEATDYGAYFLNQLYEMLTQYGQVDEVWFDGAQGNIPPGKFEDYDFGAYYSLVRKLAPNAVISVIGPDVRWVGNEGGLARQDEWSTIPLSTWLKGSPQPEPSPQAPELGTNTALASAVQAGKATELAWYPAEADVSIRPGWFYHPDQSPKSVAELMDIYNESVGRNSVLLLNVPPDQSGRLPASDVARLAEWNAALRQAMPADLALGRQASVGDGDAAAVVDGDLRTSVAVPGDGTGAVEIGLGAPTPIDRIAVSEDIADGGQQIESFVVDARVDGQWQQVATGGAVGFRRILALPAVRTDGVRIRVTTARSQVRLSAVSLYAASPKPVPAQSDYYLDCSAEVPGRGTHSAPMRSLGQLRDVNLPEGSTVHVKSGTTCAEPLELWGYGTAAAPARLVAWGDGAEPVIAAPGNTKARTALEYQGWVVEGVFVLDTVSGRP
jgi:alpha-L-fucosidase